MWSFGANGQLVDVVLNIGNNNIHIKNNEEINLPLILDNINTNNYPLTLENLVKIFKIDPEFCQNILLEEENKDNSIALMEEMIRKNLTCMFQIVFIEFNTINSNEGKSSYKNIINILEFII